ncbi:hypothetical protein B1748_21820 [Paenibacillus sp. MY03]|uniref:extracellular solute-binding protein n=1 Tax=Paenibacillus sp. MY03 TaxID=302980 RepID=UPI000B3C9B25|nr:extracellular solute-binding protein [Paenibacillus sp. MY03]OUS73983.1 hypothetical protein B1748_21820 [Paenibacillus sp. MY03]
MSTRFIRNFTLLFVLSAMLTTACTGGAGKPESTAGTGRNTATANPEATSIVEEHDPFGRYEEPLEISIGKSLNLSDKSLPEGDTPISNQFTRYLEKRLNLKFKAYWQAGGEAYSQKVSVATASGDLPDAMVVYSYSELRKLVDAGLVEDMTEVIEQYASPLVKEIYAAGDHAATKAATFGGRVMAIPASQGLGDSMYMMFIRQDWLDKLGLQAPTTLEELEHVIAEFLDKNPGNVKDQIGLPAYSLFGMTNNFPTLNPIFASYGAFPTNWVKDKDGNVMSGLIAPETRESLAKLREMYAAGLIDKEFALRKDVLEPIISNRTGVFFGPWWMGFNPLNQSMQNDPEAQWKAYLAPLGKDGKYNTHVQSPSSMFYVVKKGYKHPEAIMKLVNVQTENEQGLDPEADMDLGVDWVNEPLRAPVDFPDSIEKDAEKVIKALNNELPADQLTSKQKRIYESWLKTKDNPTSDIAAWSEAFSYVVGGGQLLEPQLNKVPSLYYGETNTMVTKGAALGKLQQEVFNKIIMGSAPIEAFDQFVIDWKKQGGDEITAEVAELLQP